MKRIKSFLVIVTLCSLTISAVVLFQQNILIKESSVEKLETSIDEILTENISLIKPDIENMFDYSAENSNDHLTFKIDNVNFDLKRDEGDSFETLLTIEYSTKSAERIKNPGYVTSVNKLKFNDNSLLLINYYTGGAHCCMVMVPYLITDGKVDEGSYLDLGNVDIFGGDDFFINGNRLFAQTYDDRFAYFESDYASSGSMFFPTFYELSLGPFGFVNRNDLFTDMYLKLYIQSQKDAEKLISQQNCNGDEISKYETFGSLVYRYSMGYFAKVDREKLKDELKNDWWCFSEKDLDKIENDIYQALTENNKSEDFHTETLLRYYEK